MGRTSIQPALAAGAAGITLVALAAMSSAAAPQAAYASAVRSPVQAGGSAATPPNGDVSVNLFEWNWKSVAAECANHLGPAGVGAVQVAPPEESVSLPSAQTATGTVWHPWYEVYQPVSYKLDSRMGNESQFAAMVTACHNAGVRVLADAVLNHMAAGNAGRGYGGTYYDPAHFSYPAVPYSTGDFHHDGTCPTSADAEPAQVWDCDLDGLPDLATGQRDVQDHEAGYLNHLISLGVDGFRFDAAGWIPPADLSAIESKLHKTTWQGAAPYIVQEVEPGYASPRLQYGNYANTGLVINFTYAQDLKTAFAGGNLASLNDVIGSNSNGDLPAGADSLDIVTNHDRERDNPADTLTYKDGTAYTLADYFMLAYPYGTPQVYDGFTFGDINQSPPSDSSGMVSDVTDATCGSQWQCLHRQPGIVGMIGWANAVSGTPLGNWTADGNQVIAFSRGDKGWFALNDTGSPSARTYATGLPDGTYCDVITGGGNGSGGCGGSEVTVSGGQANVTIPADSAVAIDVDSVISG